MRLVAEEGLTLGWMIHSFRAKQLVACFVVKATYRLVPGGKAVRIDPLPLSGDRYRRGDPQSSLLYATDFAPRKPRGDLLVVATAYAPGERAVPGFPVRVRLGDISKELLVLGRRARQNGHTATPSPITSLPVDYEFAFGGGGWPNNPIGLGRTGDVAAQIEYPQGLVAERRDHVLPAGFGPVAPGWMPRAAVAHQGLYDEHWLARRWPWLPEDFDYGFFNAAPTDQQVAGFFSGNEVFSFENLHRQHATFAGRLADERVRCFIEVRGANRATPLGELPMTLDTLWFDLDRDRVVTVWRGAVEVRDPKLTDIEHVLAWTETASAPARPATDYQTVLAQQLLPETIEEPQEAEVARDDEAFEAGFAAMDAELADAEAAGAVPEAGLPEGADESRSTAQPDNAPPDWESFIAAHPELTPEQAEWLKAAFEEMHGAEAEFKELEQEFAAEFPESLTRERVLAIAADRGSLDDLNLGRLDLSGGEFSGLSLLRADLSTTRLANANFEGADLRGAILCKADLSGANLTGARLDGADLTGATLTGALLAGISVAGTTLAGLKLAGADLSRIKGDQADFSGADLTGAVLAQAHLTRADLTGARLDAAVCTGAVLSRAALDGVTAAHASFEGADLSGASLSDGADFTGANFRRARAGGAVLSGSTFDGADFRHADLARAQLGEASLRGAHFDAANAPNALFDDAVLRDASFRRANLLRAAFDRADLRAVDLRGANLYEAGFWEATLQGANFEAANLKGTLLA